MKIRYMKDKVKRHLNLKYEEISIHFFICTRILALMQNFEIHFWDKHLTTNKS